MKTRIIITSMMGAALTLSSAASAQEKITVNGNIDLVNNYVWRGMDQNSGFSVQPTLGLSYKGLSLSAWGSQSLTNNADRDVQELDINLSYSIGRLSATLTDYWWGGLHNPYGYYYDKAAITDISLKASKDVALSDKLSLPIFVQAIASPVNDHVYLVTGVGIGF